MGRIRSVHPSLFTDEDFVSLSDAAQVFFIGLWTEADDFGAFEWKPITLKMKLRPASTHPVEPLLAELVTADRIRKYEHDGRHYGVIRNFCRFQRPKFPKSQHTIPPDYRKYTGSTAPITEIKDDGGGTFPRNAEIAPQMEDGGGRREEEASLRSEEPPYPAERGGLLSRNSRVDRTNPRAVGSNPRSNGTSLRQTGRNPRIMANGHDPSEPPRTHDLPTGPPPKPEDIWPDLAEKPAE